MIHHAGVSIRNRWTSWEVEQLNTHSFYVVLESHWPRWKLKAYIATEIICCVTEMVRQRLPLPRTNDSLTSPQQYRERLSLRLRMQSDLFWGRIKPERRCQPIGPVSQSSVSAVATLRG